MRRPHRQRFRLWVILAVLVSALGVGGFVQSRLSHERPAGSRVVVLGIDAMDYGITKELMAKGKLPAFRALADEGTFLPLQTSMPPLSPVAWTNFTTGMNPGGHGIFDFLRRDPQRVKDGFLPEDGVSKIVTDINAEAWSIPFTSYVWPPEQRRILLRTAPAFWDILEANGIDAVIYKMPANFPVSATTAQTLAGMGTPDIEGSYGTFTYFTDRLQDSAREVTGGRIIAVSVVDGVVRAVGKDGEQNKLHLCGPINPFLSKDLPFEQRRTTVEFQAYVDPVEHSVAIVIQGQDIVVEQGEWSPWAAVEFELLPKMTSVRGNVRFYLQQVSPSFRLFVSPVNLAAGTDGLATGDLDVDLLKVLGPSYTKGMSEQTKALTQGLFTEDEYLTQSDLVLEDRLRALDVLMDQFKCGLLFFYISTLDLDCHVLWKHQDTRHPAYDPRRSRAYARTIADRYVKMDAVVSRVRSRLRPKDCLYVISDHGFVSFRREFNLVAWLAQEGYLVYDSPVAKRLSKFYESIDWGKSRAFGVGFNGIYVNLKDREASGIVRPNDYESLVEEIRSKLLALRDDGRSVFRHVYCSEEVYSGSQVRHAPDLILGYNAGFGPSDDSVLGTWSDQIVADHTDGFSGHHFVDYPLVPGVLFSTCKLSADHARLEDVTVTLLQGFGIARQKGMTGESLF